MRVKDYQSGYNISEIVSKLPTPISNAIEIGPPVSGLNLKLKPIDINLNETPYCKNARITRNYIEPRPGLTLIASGFDDIIMYIREFVTSAGVSYQVIITIKSLYYSTNLTTFTRLPWYYSTGTVTTQVASKIVTGVSSLWAANLRVGDIFKCDADSTWKTISSVDSNTQITLTANYGVANSGVAYKIDRYFGGTFEDAFWGITIADADYFTFSQGIDPVLYTNVSMDQVRRLSSDCPAASSGILYADRLLIGNLTNLPYRLQWCVRGDYDNWDITQTGAGVKDWTEDPQGISGLSVAQGVLIVYKPYSISHVTETGNSTSPFEYKTKVPGIGLFYPGIFFSVGDADVIGGSDNFYSYDTRSTEAVGDKVKDEFLRVVNPQYTNTAHSLVVEETGDVVSFFASANNTTPNKAWVWNYDMDVWSSEWELEANSSGYATQQVSESWDASVGDWDSDSDIWDSAQILASVPLNMIAQTTKLYRLDSNSPNDDGEDFTFDWWTKELGARDFKAEGDKAINITRVKVFYYCSIASTLLCSLSGDGGLTFTSEVSVALDYNDPSKEKIAFFGFNSTFNTVIVRFRCTDGGRFQIVKVRIEGIAIGDIVP